MTRDQQRQMRNAIDTVELALSHMDIETMVQKFEGADDTVMVKVPLEQLRRLASAYPALNSIINDPAFIHHGERRQPSGR